MGGTKSALRGCSIVGKWRSFDTSEHNMTMTFVADGTYLSNVESKSFPCHGRNRCMEPVADPIVIVPPMETCSTRPNQSCAAAR